jgi:hypothetical protein
MMSQRDPATLAPDERFREIAGILAAGVRRLRDRAALHVDQPNPKKTSQASKTPLEVAPETVLSVHDG